VLLTLALAGLAEGQVLRGPDLGLWFRQESEAGGASALIVDGLLEDGPFAAAGLREGDKIVSVDGRPIDSELQFVRAVMGPSNADHAVRLVVARGGQQRTISLKSRDVWNGVALPDPFYQAGFLVDELHREAIVVLRVFPLTPAFYAGLRTGDVITSVSGQSVSLPADVAPYFRVGGRLALGVLRGGASRQLHILLPSRRPLAATIRESSGGFQPPASVVPHAVPVSTPQPVLIPPQNPGPLSPIRSALPPDTQRPFPF
jgi:S1-C subfamily serine protease